MATTKKKRPKMKLQCEVCKKVNYHTNKTQEMIVAGTKMSLKKFCKSCRKHTVHKEGKK
ncbi:MAG: 50S ribosomal protein L33 [Candidatus Pacebacteria bacterium]|nr:50S ribosomal protein L33 [Candidatus Paceibacterota bacterium]MDD5621469.1 50S ribosomal protein L33 [Candidatus Paceibacterota bacterium]